MGVDGKDRWRPARNCVTAEQQDAAGQAARRGKTDRASRLKTIVERTRTQVAAEGVDPALPLSARPPAGEQTAPVVGADLRAVPHRLDRAGAAGPGGAVG